jgi:hypothetical protein
MKNPASMAMAAAIKIPDKERGRVRKREAKIQALKDPIIYCGR